MATFKCPWCSYKSGMKSSLRNHMRTDCRSVPTQYRATAYDDSDTIADLLVAIDLVVADIDSTSDYSGNGGNFGGGGSSSSWDDSSSSSSSSSYDSSSSGDSGSSGGD